MKALVLSGGGARGAYEAGVAVELLRTHDYDIVCGSSIGAINAAFVAALRPDRLAAFWREVLPSRAPILLPHVPRLRHMLAEIGDIGRGSPWANAMRMLHAISDVRSLGLFGRRHNAAPNSRLATLARELGELVDLPSVKRRLLVSATNVTYGLPATFYAACDPETFATPDHRAERRSAMEWRALDNEFFAWAILASAALPGLFAPIELASDFGQCRYADGSLVHNSPIGLAIDAGATDITVVFVDPIAAVHGSCPEHDIGRMACAVFILWQQRVLDYELRLVESTNALVRSGALPERKEIRVRSIRPEYPLAVDLLGFDDFAGIEATYQQGVRDAQKEPVTL